MSSINRAAVILKPRAPFLKWVNDADPNPNAHPLTMDDLQKEPTVYLIPEFDSDEEAAELVKAGYEILFENVLLDWYTDESLWPKNRTYEMFCRWFDYSVYSIVLDLVDAPLIREEED